MRILIIRHGDPDYDNDTLTKKGWREAELLAKKLVSEKIDYIYSSPLGRAKHTCLCSAKAMGREQDVVVCDWLREFIHDVTLPTGETQDISWDLLPSLWTETEKLYHYKDWKTQDFYQNSGIDKEYDEVIKQLDALIAKHGYVREGNSYRVEKRNRDTIALFCHFGLEAVLLSRLCNISPLPLWHHFVALPTSVTTLYTEERREGQAVFRMTGFGDTGHLYAGGEPPSFSARFCETFDSIDERKD